MNPGVNAYVAKLSQEWQRKAVIELRRLIHQSDNAIQETLKWGAPAFEHNGIVVWVFCAKDWVHLSFPQGALLDNGHNLFEPTQNKAQRTVKLYKNIKIPGKIIVQLLKEAVRINSLGQQISFTPEPHRPIVLPDDMDAELRAHGVKDDYFSRPYYQQKGYIKWIDQAKQKDTRIRRITRMIEELQEDTYMPPKKSKM